jgi:TolB-like protein/Flp pilus assembly protein TadD
MPSPVDRLKERKVVQWGVAYLAAAFVAVQVVDLLAEPFSISAAVRRTVFVGAAGGFFATLVLAWYHGEKGRQRVSGAEVLIIALLLTITGGVLRAVKPGSPDAGPTAGNESGVTDPDVERDDRPSIAVLPFEVRGSADDDRYLADGLHHELLTRLSEVSGLRVISRTSVMGYRDAPKPVPEIGRELGVQYVLDGGLQRAGDGIRLNVQLIEARADAPVWGDVFDQTVSEDNLFEIQSRITTEVAGHLRVVIRGEEFLRVAGQSTDNKEAYSLYLQGVAVASDVGLGQGRRQREAIPYFERALQVDPDFALAAADLSSMHSSLFGLGDRTEERAMAALTWAQRAMEWAPGSPEGHYAMAMYHYRIATDYREALREVELAGRETVGGFTIFSGYIERRADRWEAALRSHLAALATAPGVAGVAMETARTYQLMHRYAEALPLFERALELEPDYPRARTGLAQTRWELHEDWGSRAGVDRGEIWVPYLRRDFDGALSAVAEAETIRIHDRSCFSRDVMEGMILRAAGRVEEAQAAFAAGVDGVHTESATRGEDFRLMGALGVAYAGLGRSDEALAAGRRSLELMSFDKDALFAPNRIHDLAQIHALLGNVDSTMVHLRTLTTRPGSVLLRDLMLDPLYDVVREEEEFAEIFRVLDYQSRADGGA